MSKPTAAFIGVSYFVLVAGMITYCIGLWNSSLMLNEKGFYFTVLMYGLFAAISVQKSVRDRAEGIKVTNVYYGLSWFSSILAILLLGIGLLNNETMVPSEKGFFGMSFLLSLFAAITVQKNTRDSTLVDNPKE